MPSNNADMRAAELGDDTAGRPTVRPGRVNFAGAIFFTLLIVGFTFGIPTALYTPMIFFTIAAGVLFFKDAFGSRPVVPQRTAPATAKPKRPLLVRLLLLAVAIGGVCILLYVGFIILVLILLGSSGGFG